MNVFNLARNAIVGLFGGRPTKFSDRPTVHERRDGKMRFEPEQPRRIRIFYREDDSPGFGPWANLDGKDMKTRQARRAFYFQTSFIFASRTYPLLSRRDRRSWARRTAAEYFRTQRLKGAGPVNVEAVA